MYELIQVSEQSYYIQSPAKIGLVKLNEQDVCLIDSGNDKDAGKKVKRILDENGWRLTTIYNTHSSPSSGQILYQGEDIAQTGLDNHRRGHVAFIFQSYNLIDYLTPMENVALTSKHPPMPILEQLGLTAEESKRNVLKLSGGQQQRVAIARALASDAQVILADEPTGNLDEDTAAEITAILKESAHKSG